MRGTAYIDGRLVGEVDDVALNLARTFDATAQPFDVLARAMGMLELTWSLPWNQTVMRRLLKPHHAFTGRRHRGTRKWTRRHLRRQ